MFAGVFNVFRVEKVANSRSKARNLIALKEVKEIYGYFTYPTVLDALKYSEFSHQSYLGKQISCSPYRYGLKQSKLYTNSADTSHADRSAVQLIFLQDLFNMRCN